MKKALCVIFVTVWFAVLAFLGISYAVGHYPGGEFSESENRTLAPLPDASSESVFSGKFGDQTEDYLSDHSPLRRRLIDAWSMLKNRFSLATVEDVFLLTLRDSDSGRKDDETRDRTENTAAEPPRGSSTSGPTFTEAPVTTAAPQTDDPAQTGEDPSQTSETSSPPEGATTPEETTSEPEPGTEIAPPPKTPASPSDYPDLLSVRMNINGSVYTPHTYSRDDVMKTAAVLERLAACIPDDGTVVFTSSVQSGYGNRYVLASSRGGIVSEPERMLDAVTSAKVRAFSGTEVIGEFVEEGGYAFYRTDMHPTAESFMRIYCKAVTYAGKLPASAEDFTHVYEQPFRGTLYRDEPWKYGAFEPDVLDIVTPRFSVETRRINGKGSYYIIPYIDSGAPSNDRYCVYLGGPDGPWTYTECDNGLSDRCLVICDSFGLIYQGYFTANYKQVHYMDPRYFDSSVTGYSVKDLIEKYGIKDVYLIFGDLHLYGKGIIESLLSSQIGD